MICQEDLLCKRMEDNRGGEDYYNEKIERKCEKKTVLTCIDIIHFLIGIFIAHDIKERA